MATINNSGYLDPFVRYEMRRVDRLRAENLRLRDALAEKKLSDPDLRACYAMLNRIENSLAGVPTSTGEPTETKLKQYAATLRVIITKFGG